MITAAELRVLYHPPYQVAQIEERIVKAAEAGACSCFGLEPHRLMSDLRLTLKEAGYKLVAEENGSLTISWKGGEVESCSG